MGSNSTQAVGVVTFLVAFVLIAAGAASEGLLLFILGIIVLAASAAIFMRAKPWESQES